MTTATTPALAVDAGQTGIKVRAVGGPPFSATYAGVQTSYDLLPQLAATVLQASSEAGRPFPTVAIGTTGLTATDNDPAQLLRLCAEAGTSRLLLAHDSITSFLGAIGDTHGVVTAAGTGVVTLGVGATVMSRVDGWGYIIGDVGSGYWIGRAALDAVLREYDGRGPATSLTPVVKERFPALDQAYITVQTDPDRVRIVASYAQAVSDLAATDAVSADICRRAGEELALSAVTAARNVGLADDPEIAICLIGGMFRSPHVLQSCEAAIAAALPHARSVPARGDGLDGAEALLGVALDSPLGRQIAVTT